MSLETAGSSETTSESVSTESPVAASTSGSGYSKVDPGYESFEIGESTEEETTPSTTVDDASETDGSTEETAETPTDDAATSQEPSDELLDRALEIGYTLDELKSFKDVKSLEAEVTRVEKVHKRLLERQAATQPVVQEVIPQVEENPEPKWDELIEQGHDPDIVALQKQTWQRAERAEAQARQLIQAEQQRAFDAQCQRFDDTLNGLEGFENILGNGRRDELAKASPELAANRQRVFTKMLGLRQLYELSGEKVPPEAELIQEAVQASFYKHAQDTARQKLKGDIKKAGSQALSRPRSSGAKPLSGPALAEAKEAEFWRKRQ